MPREIERKFLVSDDAWRRSADAGRRLRQAYLAETGRAAIRVRIEDGARAVLTIKSAEPGLSRAEFEYSIPLADAEALAELRQGSLLDKTRYRARQGDHVWEIDVYAGENEGLTVAEIELENERENIDPPAWLGREVTDNSRYYAAKLAMHPFRQWTDSERRSSG
jgi:adenylate cyclase